MSINFKDLVYIRYGLSIIFVNMHTILLKYTVELPDIYKNSG